MATLDQPLQAYLAQLHAIQVHDTTAACKDHGADDGAGGRRGHPDPAEAVERAAAASPAPNGRPRRAATPSSGSSQALQQEGAGASSAATVRRRNFSTEASPGRHGGFHIRRAIQPFVAHLTGGKNDASVNDSSALGHRCLRAMAGAPLMAVAAPVSFQVAEIGRGAAGAAGADEWQRHSRPEL